MITTETIITGQVKSGLGRLHWLAAIALALCCGGVQPLALAPFNLWPLAIVGLAGFALLLFKARPKRAWALATAFGVGLYGIGVSWVFVAINQFGNASWYLAAVLTALFVLFLALIFAAPFVLCIRLIGHGRLGILLGFPACYLLGEWLRSWLLTGFPWLYIGYGHLSTPLAGWAPVLGVLGVGLITSFSAACLASWAFFMRPSANLWMATALALALWGAGWFLQPVAWTKVNNDQPVKVAMVQPNIAQEVKWQPAQAQPTLDLLMNMSEPHWDSDWLIWPEAAVPLTYHTALDFLNEVTRQAVATDTGVITGIIFDERRERRYYNSLVGLGNALGIYHKRRLVPFGEYVPLAEWLRGAIQFFDLPTSYIHRGTDMQSGLQVGEVSIAPSICYEVVYPSLVADGARHRNVLLTVSNDAWFADSIGPLQHLQMAQMRALETGRYLLRSTNNGVSAVVDEKGVVIERSEQFVQTTLTGTVYPAYGATPFMRWGSWPVIALSLGLLLGLLAARRRFHY
ncbi:apolipoprotein N-acyltransferase [Gilvimarinus sp. SDUM040013]|uniref:Apolipoprotein N-acyltransferase n=1 Tax=Gilvimarinus gilvus TaxID=3058038 RepID=A0ABU4RSH7_9GAMM|nr:apolipoprotein N-acyltransferase [Gilvimarinus sp. SDUM040013]MDO3388290.1 apolipoprotein N-acyltransferase [Gilvimarinus sp. SDUM040013]MDX6847840.1 apolipoprotein N-acyltransferase [Gilvimarinus sp. SDUM040013]